MVWDTIASFATALGVAVATWQIWISRRLAATTFEDSFDQQYRELSMKIPVDALLGKVIKEDEVDHVRELIFNYLDLCNEQVSLRKKKRVGRARWQDWCEGIENNLEKPAFKDVWKEVRSQVPDEFSYLLKLEQCGFRADPARWS